MGNRTAELPELSGIAHLIREARYHEFSRQALGILLLAVFAWWAAPQRELFWVGTGVAIIGIAVRLYASGFVMKNKELATDGPYAFVRHPLYTGNILMLIGFCLANGRLWPWLVGIFFLWFWYPPAISYEDKKLERIFGDSWRSWSAYTPALVPRKFSSGGSGDNHWSFAKSMRANWEPVIVVYSIICLWWLWRQLPPLS